MKTRNLTLLALAASISAFAVACVPDDGHHDDHTDPETEVYRQALASEGDIALEYGDGSGTVHQGLNGERSEIAGLTVDAVAGTNAFIFNHIQMLKAVSQLPPSAATDNSRTWQGEDGDVFMRLHVEKSDTPRGTRFDYVLSGRPADDADADMIGILSGDIVRIETRPEELGKQGFGVVRFNFTNFNTLRPSEQIEGMARVAFRRVGEVRQVHVRNIGIKTLEHPNYPEAAEYKYTQLPERGGELRFFGKGDVLNDGAPFESFAVASAWRANRTGIGTAVVFDGSLQVDYWNLGQCWDTGLIVGYEKLETPGWSNEEGTVETCFDLPEMETPAFQESLPDEDPEIPAAHPAE